MKRTISALLLVILLLAGCGASSNQDYATSDSASGSNSAPEAGKPMDNNESYVEKGEYDTGWAENDSAGGEIITDSSVSASPILSDSKMIYSADVTLETRDFDKAGSDLTALVNAMGGYFERRELNQNSSYRSLYCTVRVPAERFSEFLSQSGEMAHMTYCNEYSENVSEAYYDLEARLTTQRTKLQRLQELLAKADDMADIITIESAISDTELQIEYLTGSLRSYDSLIGFSTIHLTLREVYRLSNEEVAPVTFGERVGNAFRRGMEQLVENAEDFVIFVARNWLTLIVYAALIAGGVVLVRRWSRKRRGLAAPKRKGESRISDDTDEN